jgi:cytochrome c peroxidase
MKKLSLLLIFATIAYNLFSIDENNGVIDLNNLYNYADQQVPGYITKDNTPPNNTITDIGATLGRVLFYDRNLSKDNTISCSSCHKQENAFGDNEKASLGVAGTTGRHSMRLVNARFATERRFFWDERASSLETQTTMPIQDHIEMGFSGEDGDPDLDSLLRKLSQIDYYNELFIEAYGDSEVTEQRIQNAIAQFVRSIQSFDSKYDENRILVTSDDFNFPNFTQAENRGRMLFIFPPQFNAQGERTGGGFGCAGCHQPPEFDIAPNSRNNGVIESFSGELDLAVTRSPSLRDLFNNDGVENTGLMHTALTYNETIAHYSDVDAHGFANNNLDNRLKTPLGDPINFNITNQERGQLRAFLRTLTGSNIYIDPKWSDPFDENGDLSIERGTSSVEDNFTELKIYPNPAHNSINIESISLEEIMIFDALGNIYFKGLANGEINISNYPKGKYYIKSDKFKGSFIKMN